jgi:predicted O-methyltransferase YrrM
LNGCEHTIYPDIEGWMYDADLLALREFAQACGGPILEIGSFCGLSTAVLSEDGRQVTCVDPFEGGEDLPQRDTYPIFTENMARLGRTSKLIVLKMRSQDIWQLLGEYPLIFVDGSHTFKNALSDINNAIDHVRRGGYLLVDDWNWTLGGEPVVTKALDASGLTWYPLPKTKLAVIAKQ